MADLLAERLHHHAGIILLEGVVLIILGAAAIALPFLAGLVTTTIIGWLLFISGVLGLATSWAMRKTRGVVWAFVSSILALLAGTALVLWPIGGLVSLTIVLGAFLFVDGIATVVLGFKHRSEGSKNWGWLLLNGVLDLVLAGWILFFLPVVAPMILGIIIGVDLIFGGFSLIAIGSAARSVIKV